MDRTKAVAFLALFCGLFVIAAHGACNYPSDLDGVFDSTHETSQLTFNSSYVSSFDINTYSTLYENLTFECYEQNGTYYVSRSTSTIDIYSVGYYVWTCWEFEKQSADRYVYYQATRTDCGPCFQHGPQWVLAVKGFMAHGQLSTADNANVKILPTGYTVEYTTICDQSAPYSYDSTSILVRNGTGSTAKTSCPVALWGQYIYSLTDTTGTTFCSFNSWMDVCTSTDTVSVNMTLCSDTVLYSTGGTLYCMYYAQDTSASNTYYVTLYNDDATVDSSATYRFTCLLLQYSSSMTYMTQYPGECLASGSQTATTISTSPGGMFSMYANVTCPPTTDSSDNTVIIVVVVLLMLILIGGGIGGGIYYYKKHYLPKKQPMSSRSKVVPDTLPNTAMSGVDKNYRMMFTPAPPRSAVPGRRGGDYGSRAVSANSEIRPTVSALAMYRTPSPFITDGKDIDVDSLLDYDNGMLSKHHLGDPDGAESGVMLDMEGSIPVYSEPGDTPEPTRITPMGNGHM